jgi:hypothetical protein
MTMRAIHFLALACFASACSKDSATRLDSAQASAVATSASATTLADSGSKSTVVPAAVVDVGEHGEGVYDEVKAKHWAKAKALVDSLDASAKALPADSRISGERAELVSALDTLRAAVAAKQALPALEAANRVTYAGAKMSAPFNPAIPVDVVLLDYYGRELEIGAARNDPARLKSTAGEIRRTWDAVKPQVISHGGTAAAKTTDSLVAKIEAAKSPAEYGKLAKPFLDVVDELEKPFTK